jgi:GDP-L-fucose synthase
MIGLSILKYLKKQSDHNILLHTDNNLDLTSQSDVNFFFETHSIDQVYITGGKSGGILANNTYPAEFIYNNLIIETNIINSSFVYNVKKLLFIGSSCVYPKSCQLPTKEDTLLTGALEPTNEPYSIAKIAGLKLCESYNRQYGNSHDIDFRSIIPTNLYGPGDIYNLEESHVVASLILRLHKAKLNNLKKITLWGTGEPTRELLFIDDLANAAVFIMNIDKEKYKNYINIRCSHINVGSGEEISILKLAILIAEIVNYTGQIEFDNISPNGTMRKILDISKINIMGWHHKTSLHKGLQETYKNFVNINKKSKL